MGLDMYLQGHQYFSNRTQTIDDFPVKEIIVELGYWRKHPNLHGAIVETFADGVDECQNIELARSDIEKLLKIVKSNELPHTQGFFFGDDSDDYYKKQDQEFIREAKADLLCGLKVFYNSSW